MVNIGDFDSFIPALDKRPANRRLADPPLPDYRNKSFPLRNGVNQMGQGLFMAFTQEKIGRVRRQLKRVFLEAEKFSEKNLPCGCHSMLRLIWRERRLTPLLLLTLMVTWPPSASVLKKSAAWSGLVIA